MSEISIEYMAGFFDGEGNVQISNAKHYPNSKQDKIRITNTNKLILDFITETFGGKIYKKRDVSTDGYKRKPTWVWAMHGRYGVKLSKQLYEICIEKKEKLGIFIERNKKNAERI